MQMTGSAEDVALSPVFKTVRFKKQSAPFGVLSPVSEEFSDSRSTLCNSPATSMKYRKNTKSENLSEFTDSCGSFSDSEYQLSTESSVLEFCPVATVDSLCRNTSNHSNGPRNTATNTYGDQKYKKTQPSLALRVQVSKEEFDHLVAKRLASLPARPEELNLPSAHTTQVGKTFGLQSSAINARRSRVDQSLVDGMEATPLENIYEYIEGQNAGTLSNFGVSLPNSKTFILGKEHSVKSPNYLRNQIPSKVQCKHNNLELTPDSSSCERKRTSKPFENTPYLKNFHFKEGASETQWQSQDQAKVPKTDQFMNSCCRHVDGLKTIDGTLRIAHYFPSETSETLETLKSQTVRKPIRRRKYCKEISTQTLPQYLSEIPKPDIFKRRDVGGLKNIGDIANSLQRMGLVKNHDDAPPVALPRIRRNKSYEKAISNGYYSQKPLPVKARLKEDLNASPQQQQIPVKAYQKERSVALSQMPQTAKIRRKENSRPIPQQERKLMLIESCQQKELKQKMLSLNKTYPKEVWNPNLQQQQKTPPVKTHPKEGWSGILEPRGFCEGCHELHLAELERISKSSRENKNELVGMKKAAKSEKNSSESSDCLATNRDKKRSKRGFVNCFRSRNNE